MLLLAVQSCLWEPVEVIEEVGACPVAALTKPANASMSPGTLLSRALDCHVSPDFQDRAPDFLG